MMVQNYQDAMVIAREFGKPDFFITMTCNPEWPEIRRSLFPGQSPHFRDDLVCKVFHGKQMQLVDAICNQHIFGKVFGWMDHIEFQKRGLPHDHSAVILDPIDKITTPEQVDNVVVAELPSRAQEHLYALVTRHMMHGPCGGINPNAKCMVDGVCSKGYPKPYQEHTEMRFNGYPLYRRRRPNGTNRDDIFQHRLPSNQTFGMDNGWVVPYNPYLLVKFECHLNVEICASIDSVKYLFKYITKGVYL